MKHSWSVIRPNNHSQCPEKYTTVQDTIIFKYNGDRYARVTQIPQPYILDFESAIFRGISQKVSKQMVRMISVSDRVQYKGTSFLSEMPHIMSPDFKKYCLNCKSSTPRDCESLQDSERVRCDSCLKLQEYTVIKQCPKCKRYEILLKNIGSEDTYTCPYCTLKLGQSPTIPL